MRGPCATISSFSALPPRVSVPALTRPYEPNRSLAREATLLLRILRNSRRGLRIRVGVGKVQVGRLRGVLEELSNVPERQACLPVDARSADALGCCSCCFARRRLPVVQRS